MMFFLSTLLVIYAHNIALMYYGNFFVLIYKFLNQTNNNFIPGFYFVAFTITIIIMSRGVSGSNKTDETKSSN